MPEFKLSYFDAYGRGEVARLIFAAAKVKFEDHRFDFEQWKATEKKEMPFEQCPVLWIDGSPLCESGAIFRYLANEFGLNGANNLQAAYIEMITGVISDAYSKLPIFEKDEEKKAAKTKEVYKDNIVPTLEKLEKKFASMGKDFLIGDKLSYADLKLMHSLSGTEKYDAKILKAFPKLVELRDRVRNTEGVKEYMDKRKDSPF